MEKAFFLTILLFFSCNTSSKLVSDNFKVNKEGFIELENFGIRKKPILNREYMLLLAWYIDVYGFSYPEKVISMLPQISDEVRTIYEDDYEQILNNPTKLFKEYVFNPKYIDYPLIGLSNNQVLELQKWMNDRYNENKLFEVGYLNFNSLQKDEDCFTTTSYLVDQYVGDVRNDKVLRWKEGQFKSNFRLPYSDELESAGISNEAILKEYKFSSKDFLWIWNEHYLETDKEITKMKFNFEDIMEFKNNHNFDISQLEYSNEILLDKNIEYISSKYLDLEILSDPEANYPFEEKNQYGSMDFVIVGENNSKIPIAASRIKLNDIKQKNKIYRIVYNKKINQEYLPKE